MEGCRKLLGTVGAFVVCFFAACAFAQMPPRTYRDDAHVVVYFTSPQNVESLCDLITGGRLRNVTACANDQIMILPNPCGYRRERYAEIVCHEIGHVNGWQPDHPD